ncbi:FliH/SctL family protein [uncultured Erythrobacter sp.]|uniref:FliH/SctL family protein n=1 Tax=uncultured Erythrobacter sp. TaxID=263913 RepID=UPI002609A3AD|nr:FliH/SctL family protein [uncultured Erythrobacter sp.]
MANSSDWIAALADPAEPDERRGTPDWIAALAAPGGFVEGLPIARKPAVVDCPADPSVTAPPPPDPVAEALARGEALGRAAANEEREADLLHRKALRLTFRELDAAAIDSLANELAETVIALCGQTLADYQPEAEALRARCEAAATRLGKAACEHALHLNPADMELLDADTKEHWQVVADPAVERGGLHFEGPDGAISDGPADWRRAIAAAIRG